MRKIVNTNDLILPTTNELELELKKEKYKFRYRKLLKSTISILLIVVAISILIATFFLPILQIYGTSMEPTLKENDILLAVKKRNFDRGDIIAFYYNNRILVKRVIAISADWVNINENGNVFVNDKLIKETYVDELSLGNSNIKYPYQVPENAYFVLGDQRSSSMDSRNSKIGSIESEEIIGKIIFRIWPLERIKLIT